MNVFTDFHHASLLKSFILLFEKRLGGAVYRPIGMDWAEKGFWKVYDHPETQAQFLGIGANTPDGTPPLNEVVNEVVNSGIYYCKDIEGNETNKAITFDAFMALPFDIVIASLPQHVKPFTELCELHPNHPKLIYQIGNAWGDEVYGAKNIMASAKVSFDGTAINLIEYHQEFDTDIFSPADNRGIATMATNEVLTYPQKNIFSFINVFQNFPDFPLFEQIERVLPEWNFKSYGGQCRDGSMNGSEELAHAMRESRFIWHTKAGGDGYGHVIHNAAACGRPLIVRKGDYQGKLAESLIIDGETAIVIDGLDNQQIVNKILHYSNPDLYGDMCADVYTNFLKVCNFDDEFIQIKAFLDRLI